MEYQYSIELNFPYEGIVLLSRYLYNTPGSSRMVKYLGRFSTEKEEIVNLYRNYDALQELVYKDFEKINIKETIKDDLRNLLNPLFYADSTISYLLRFMRYNYDDLVINECRINDFFGDAFLALDKCQHKEVFTVKNVADVIRYADLVGLDQTQKMQFIILYTNYEDFFYRMLDLACMVGNLVKTHIKVIEDDIKEINHFLECEDNVNEMIQNLKRMPKEIKSIKVMVVLFETASYYVHYNSENMKAGLFISYLYSKIRRINADKKEVENNALDAFKALSDRSRYQIVKILSGKKTYAQDLARHLDLSPATIIHHLDVLQKVGLIRMLPESNDNKKNYYEINEKMIRLISENLLDLIE